MTTSSVTQGMLSLSHMKFRKSTESAWRRCALCVAAMSDAVVRAELEGLPIPSELLEGLEQSQRQLDRASYGLGRRGHPARGDVHVARREIMYHTGSLFEDAEHQANHHLQHVNRAWERSRAGLRDRWLIPRYGLLFRAHPARVHHRG